MSVRKVEVTNINDINCDLPKRKYIEIQDTDIEGVEHEYIDGPFGKIDVTCFKKKEVKKMRELLDEIDVTVFQRDVIGTIKLFKKQRKKGSDIYVYTIECNIKFESDGSYTMILPLDTKQVSLE